MLEPKHLEGMIESAMDAIIAVDGDQRIVLFNAAAVKMFGCPAQDAIGTSIDRFIPERFRAAHREHVRRFDKTGLTKRDLRALGELWGLRTNGKEFPVEASISQTEAGGRKLLTVIIRDITERKLAEEALSDMSRKLIEAREQERTFIARELHDDVNQRIALLAVNLESLKPELPASAAAVIQSLAKISEQGLDLASNVQALSHRLHSSKLEYLGLVAAAASFCEVMSDRQNVQIDFRSSGIPRELPQEIALCLLRVLQEALQNAMKHSGVQHFDPHRRMCCNDTPYQAVRLLR